MNGKAVLCASILLIAVLICGCTTTTSQQNTVAAAVETPSLIGNWTGTMVGYEYGIGYTNFSGYTITMSVTEQEDRSFRESSASRTKPVPRSGRTPPMPG